MTGAAQSHTSALYSVYASLWARASTSSSGACAALPYLDMTCSFVLPSSMSFFALNCLYSASAYTQSLPEHLL